MLTNVIRLVVVFVMFAIAAATAAPASIGDVAFENLKGKTILLGGATGNNGRHVLRQLHDLGLDVRAMTRNVEDAIADHGSQYTWIKADVTDPDSLSAAVEGVDIVISAIATAMPIGGNRPEKVDYEGTRNLAAAAKAAGVTRFVIITSSNSGVKDHFLNTIGGNVLIWKGKAEEVLVDSGLEYVVLAPAGIDDRPGGERAISLIPRNEYESGMVIGRDDMATVAIAAAGLPDAANRVFTATNVDAPASDAWLSSFATLPRDLNLPTE